jgi:hypothetical protein
MYVYIRKIFGLEKGGKISQKYLLYDDSCHIFNCTSYFLMLSLLFGFKLVGSSLVEIEKEKCNYLN